jgi:hypothetical protein
VRKSRDDGLESAALSSGVTVVFDGWARRGLIKFSHGGEPDLGTSSDHGMPSRAARRVLGFRTCALLQARRGSSGRGRHCRRERIQPWSRSTLLGCGTKRRPSDKRQTPHQGPAAVASANSAVRVDDDEAGRDLHPKKPTVPSSIARRRGCSKHKPATKVPHFFQRRRPAGQ